MASFTDVGDSVELQMAARGDVVSIAISGTYNMTILFQREVGSPGSGAWETLQTFNTEDATEAATHVTKFYNEKLRLILTVDAGGTAVSTLDDNFVKTHPRVTVRDEVGNVLAQYSQGGVKFPDSSLQIGGPVTIAAALTLDPDLHAERLLVFDIAAGVTVTLPAATGSGVKYRFFVGTTVTSVADVIEVASAADTMAGVVVGLADGGSTMNGWEALAASDTISLNGGTTGGLVGDYIEVEDAKSTLWRVTGFIAQTDAEATPFSAAV